VIVIWCVRCVVVGVCVWGGCSGGLWWVCCGVVSV
jgi:hypothetical protein